MISFWIFASRNSTASPIEKTAKWTFSWSEIDFAIAIDPWPYALAFTTQYAHKFNSSKYSSRFERLVDNLKFEKISLKQNISDAADLILNDHKHIDNNPKPIKKNDIENILKKINSL